MGLGKVSVGLSSRFASGDTDLKNELILVFSSQNETHARGEKKKKFQQTKKGTTQEVRFFPTSDLQASLPPRRTRVTDCLYNGTRRLTTCQKTSLGFALSLYFKKNASFTTTVELNVVVFKNTQSHLNHNQQILSKYVHCARWRLSKAFGQRVFYARV